MQDPPGNDGERAGSRERGRHCRWEHGRQGLVTASPAGHLRCGGCPRPGRCPGGPARCPRTWSSHRGSSPGVHTGWLASQCPNAWAPPPEAPQEAPNAPAPPLAPPSTYLIKIFVFVVIPGVQSELQVLPSFLWGIGSLSGVGGMCSGPSGCQEVLSQSQQGTLLKATCWVSGPSQCSSGCLRGPLALRE